MGLFNGLNKEETAEAWKIFRENATGLRSKRLTIVGISSMRRVYGEFFIIELVDDAGNGLVLKGVMEAGRLFGDIFADIPTTHLSPPTELVGGWSLSLSRTPQSIVLKGDLRFGDTDDRYMHPTSWYPLEYKLTLDPPEA